RLLVTTIDNTLSGDPEGAARLIDVLKQSGDHVGFGVVTGRRPESAMEALAALGCPPPDVLISCLGTEIRYGASLTPDPAWHRHINYQWEPGEVRAAMAGFPGLELQNEAEQRRFKISYRRNGPDAPDRQRIARHLRRQGLRVQVICSHGTFVDLLPIRASPGLAVRAVAFKWGVPLDRVLTAGDSGDDEDMLAGNTLAVVVGGYNPELELLRGRPRVRFADGRYAWGVLEAIDYYNFLGEIRVPEEAERADAP
ncbi:MAG: HAD hydrolase family protein, partial [Verrucomicrobia bacterium]|nr:HAD hydrolase family protein [Verrucomicrobiota bacterium]